MGQIYNYLYRIFTGTNHIDSFEYKHALLNGLSEEHASKVYNYHQIEALRAGANLEQALYHDGFPFFAEKAGATPEQASLFKNKFQIKAYEAGATPEQASLFINELQIKAYEAGATPEQASLFRNEFQVKAYEAGAPADEALKFHCSPQINAFKYGVSLPKALMFDKNYQIMALEMGIPEDSALLFSKKEQIIIYKTSADIDDALSSNSPTMEKLLAQKEDFIKVIEEKFIECESARPNIYEGIKDQLLFNLNRDLELEEMKSDVEFFFDSPCSFDTGEKCSEMFMEIVKDYKYEHSFIGSCIDSEL